jgi:hypothetical protein
MAQWIDNLKYIPVRELIGRCSCSTLHEQETT